jgi:hypothetical protein
MAISVWIQRRACKVTGEVSGGSKGECHRCVESTDPRLVLVFQLVGVEDNQQMN